MNFDADRLSKLSGLGPVESTGVLAESVELQDEAVSEEGDNIDECCGCAGNPDKHDSSYGPMITASEPAPELVGHGHSHVGHSHDAPLSVSADDYLFEMEDAEDDDDDGDEPPKPEKEVNESILNEEGGWLKALGAPGLIARAVVYGESPVTDATSAVEKIKGVVDSVEWDALSDNVRDAAAQAVVNIGKVTGGVLSTPEARAGALTGALNALPGISAIAAAAVGAAASSDTNESSSPLTMETLRNTVIELRDEILAEQAEERQALAEAPARTAIRREIKALLAEMPADAATNWIYGKKGKPSSAHNKSRATALAGVGFANSKN